MTEPKLVRAFWVAACASFLASLLGLCGIGWAASMLLAGPKPVRFANSFFEFRLPQDWTCRQEQTEQVCRSTRGGIETKSAAIILTMKFRGPQDTFAAYLDHLRTPQTLRLNSDGHSVGPDQPAVQEIKSEVRLAQRRRIGAHDWVEGLHFNSEVQGYFTHYYATMTSQLALLVTFTAHRDYHDLYREDIEAMVRSLVIFQSAQRQ
jgi:hypothetical protein